MTKFVDNFILIFIAPALVLAYVCYLLIKRTQRMGLLQACGIPSPKPNFLIGNLDECMKIANVKYDSQLVDKYGPITGYYLGAKPIILVADPELLKFIQVTDSQCFLDRPRRVPGGISVDPRRTYMLGNLCPLEWNKTRKILTKAFTPAKLREMIPQIQEKTSIFLRVLGEKIMENPEEVDFYSLFQGLTLDIIGQTGFGVESHVQENPDDPLHLAVKSEFEKTPNTMLVKLYMCLPEFSWLLHPVRIHWEEIRKLFGWSESSALWDQGFKSFQERVNLNGPPRHDLLQQLVDSDLVMDPLKVVANSVLFFEAAYETLSSCLGFTVNLLTNHPEIQERVRQELITVRGVESKLTYEMLTELKYLEMVIKESLRMFPPQTTFIGRSGKETVSYEKDGKTYIIPKNVHIQAALYQMQNSEENWPQPNVFDPDRFSPENSADKDYDYIWQAFGKGPRVCIGQKFAWIVLKLVLGKLLLNYKLKPSAHTEKIITLKFKTATMTPQHGSFALPVPVEEIQQNFV